MIPRRNRLDLNTPAELAIRAAVDEVEKVGADVRLTEAVILLGRAREKVADYIDATPTVVTDPAPACDIFQNGSAEECGGPHFTDPGSYGDPDMRICAFHALLNRNEWMTRATSAEREVAALKDAVARAEDAHEHDIWAACGCLGGAGIGHPPDSMDCPFPGETR